ncbi:MAG: DUF5723 family protein [Bacteroidota bacterium]|nr:DUF5723 family protein [Bacteroidota bacterium]
MRIKQIVVLLALMSVFSILGNAQSNLVFYNEDEQFNASNFNPAFLTSQKKFTFSIFPLAGMTFGFNNQEVIKDVMNQFLKGNQTTQDFKGVFNSLVNQDLFFLNYETNLFSFGYNSAFGSFNFRIRENVLLMTDFKGDLSDFLMNPAFQDMAINKPQLFGAEALHYREYSLGFAREIIKDKLSVGGRAKIYYGKSILFSEVTGKIVERSDTFFTQIAGPMRLSIPANPDLDNGILVDLNMAKNFNIGNYITNAGNIGVGIDFGFKYKITPEIEFSASVVDLGKINWKQNINTLLFNDEYPFPEENIDVTLDENGVPVLTKFNDKPLADTISFSLTLDETAFSKSLPTIFYAGLKYQVNPKLNIGAVNRFSKTKGLNYNSFSLTAHYEATQKLSIITGYSIIGNSFSNIPIAILYKRDGGQTYLGTDNVLSFLSKSSEFSGISFGTCFYLFTGKVKYKDPLEYLPFFKRKKPRLFSKT